MRTKSKKNVLTKAEKIHYIIFRQLDIYDVSLSYERATQIVEELKTRKLI